MKKLSIFLGIIALMVGTLLVVVPVQATQNHEDHHDHHGPYPTVTNTPVPSPTINPCQLEYVEEKGDDWQEENPCITPSPEPTGTPTVVFNGSSDGNHSPGPGNPTTGAIVCNGENPTEAYQLNGTKTDTGFHLTWHVGTDGTKQTLFYGPTQDKATEFGYPGDLGSQENWKDINVKGWSHIFFVVKTWRNDCTKDSTIGDP